MVLERVRKCPLVYPIMSAVYIPYVRCLYPIGEAPGGGVRPLSEARGLPGVCPSPTRARATVFIT